MRTPTADELRDTADAIDADLSETIERKSLSPFKYNAGWFAMQSHSVFECGSFIYRIAKPPKRRPMNREEWDKYMEDVGCVRPRPADVLVISPLLVIEAVKSNGVQIDGKTDTFSDADHFYTRPDGSPLTVEE